MPLIVYLGSFAVVSAIGVLWWSLTEGATADPLARVRSDGVTRIGAPGRVLQRARGAAKHLPLLTHESSRLERSMASAGLGPAWTLERVLLAKAALALAAIGVGLPYAVRHSSGLLVLATITGALGGWYLPDAEIAGKASEHQRGIELQLPDLLDRLTISIEAGLGFDSALARVVQKGHGPAYDEFGYVLQDLQLGIPRDAALQALADRTSVQDLRLFVSAIVQSGRYGLPLANIMRVQAAELRDKRRQRAQERAMKIPVKIVMPLVLCVLPTLFIVLIGPVIVRISNQPLFSG